MGFGLVFQRIGFCKTPKSLANSCVVFHWLGTWLPAWEREPASRLVAAQFFAQAARNQRGSSERKSLRQRLRNSVVRYSWTASMPLGARFRKLGKPAKST